MDDDDELFHRYDPEVLAANGIEYPPDDTRMRMKWWAFLMQVEGNLRPTNMSVPSAKIIRYPDRSNGEGMGMVEAAAHLSGPRFGHAPLPGVPLRVLPPQSS